MSKRNKVVYSNIQPNTKEAGIWVNTDDGNIKIEKDGKWVDDGGSSETLIVKYYKFKDRIDTNDNSMRGVIYGMVWCPCFTFKVFDSNYNTNERQDIAILPGMHMTNPTGYNTKYVAFSFVPGVSVDDSGEFVKLNTIEDFYKDLSYVTNFEEITEEEYLDLTNLNGVIYE